MDINGIMFLLKVIYTSMTPIYKALFMYPVLNYTAPTALMSNHIFSSTLQMFYLGMDQKVIQPIHAFHQYVFYEPNSTNFKSYWDFESREDLDIEMKIFIYAIKIRETKIMDMQNEFLQYDSILLPQLKSGTINRVDFLNQIRKGIHKQFGIIPPLEHQDIWNNLGELMQYYGILFYQTCVHAVILDELLE